jgi:hypothetical protein
VDVAPILLAHTDKVLDPHRLARSSLYSAAVGD